MIIDFPYKDCVLVGGQTKEEQKERKEVFLNQTLAKDEITQLFEPKVLTNWKRFDQDGEYQVSELSKNKDGTLNENLIIKGNNLIALHSIKKLYRGKVKLIYLDPPYNTGGDGFGYNDKFNHSTWLTFMKDRLKEAKELMRNDGVIFIHCDDNEQAYLKVLMDEVFGRKNFVMCAVWNSIKSVLKNPKNNIRKEHEFILCSWKNEKISYYSDEHRYLLITANKKDNLVFNRLKNKMKFENPDNDPKGNWFNSNAAASDQNKNTNRFPIPLPNGQSCVRNWKFTKDEYENGIISLYFKGSNVPRLKVYENEYKKNTRVQSSIFQDLGSITSAKKELKALDLEFKTPKPEILAKRIIELSTKQGDIILDFFLGSGTSCAVAHKMGRRYIGIEQMDYIEITSIQRIKKVIQGEQGGISKEMKWKGGGDFIYCELAKNTQFFAEKIQEVNDVGAVAILNQLKESQHIVYRVKFKCTSDEKFKELSLDNKKKILIDILDKNMLYIPFSEIDNQDFEIDEYDKNLSKEFYQHE